MKTYIARAVLTALLPMILTGAFIITLCTEIVSAFGFAWLQVRIEFNSYMTYMRRQY